MIVSHYPANVKAFGDDADAPELKLSLTADKSSISAGDTVTFTLTLENTSDVFDLADVTAAGEHFSQGIGRISAGKTEARSYSYAVSDADAAAEKLDGTLTVTVGTKGSQPQVLMLLGFAAVLKSGRKHDGYVPDAYCSFFLRNSPENLTAANPNTVIRNAPAAVRRTVRELLPVCGRLTSLSSELASPMPVTGSTV